MKNQLPVMGIALSPADQQTFLSALATVKSLLGQSGVRPVKRNASQRTESTVDTSPTNRKTARPVINELSISLATGEEMTVDTDALEPSVGDAATVNSKPASGDYVTIEGDTLHCESGKITKITPATEANGQQSSRSTRRAYSAGRHSAGRQSDAIPKAKKPFVAQYAKRVGNKVVWHQPVFTEADANAIRERRAARKAAGRRTIQDVINHS